MNAYRKVTFPPSGPWDPRLGAIACPDLQPVERLHENEWFSVMNRGGYFTVEYRDPQIVVLPVVEREAYVLVRVKRPVIGDCTLELPAGSGHEGEDPVVAAARELAEETGIAVEPKRLVPMPPLAVSPNRMPNLIHVFRVDLSRREFDARGPHDDEIESVHLVNRREVLPLILSGGLYTAVPIAILSTHLLQGG